MALKKILMVISGEMNGQEVKAYPFVISQAKSLQNFWNIIWGLTGRSSTSLVAAYKNIKKFRRMISDQKIDLVHAQYGSINAVIGLLSSAWKSPFVVSFCGDDVLGTIQPGIKWRIREVTAKLLSQVAGLSADHIIAKSLNIKQALPEFLQKKVSIIPNGVDTNFFLPMDKIECRNTLGLSPSKFYILFNHSLGNNLLRKNKPLADAAMDFVKQHFNDAELLITGQVSQLQMPIFINASDAVLQTSLHEGSPNIIKEAMACDVPVISVPCGDVHERITNDSIGFICDYDAQALALKIIEVLQNGSRSKGRESIFKQELSSEQVAKRISKIYNTLLP